MANSWELTWEEILNIGKERKHPVTDWYGRLICSQDRKLDARQGRAMYLESLRAARKGGAEIPSNVRASEQHIFGTEEVVSEEMLTRKQPFTLPELLSTSQPRSEAPLSLFD